MERATGTEVYGCGSSQTTNITLNIQTTTGGNFSISLSSQHTVDHLKKLVSKKLKVSKDRICLLHRERQLRDGTLDDNGLLDGSRVILLPSVETGLLGQRPENSVMQALESLNDSQVNDFLSGKSPLNLTMRLGDHMMLIQLQLSTIHGAQGCRQLRTSTPAKNTPTAVTHKCDGGDTTMEKESDEKSPDNDESQLDKSGKEKSEIEPRSTVLQKKDLEMIQNAFELYRTFAEEKFGKLSEEMEDKDDSADTTNCTLSDLSNASTENEHSPIKSLSNLVSSPIDSSTHSKDAALINVVKNNIIQFLAQNKSNAMPSTSAMCDKPCPSTSHTPDSSISDDSGDNFTDQSSFLAESTIDEYPMENLFNSAVDKGLFEDHDETMMDREISNLATTSHGTQESTTTLPSFQSLNEPLKSKRYQFLLHKTSKFKHPIAQNKQKAFMQSVVNKHNKRMQNRQENNLTQPSTSRTEPYITSSRKLILQPSVSQADDNATPSTSKQSSFKSPEAPKKPARASPTPTVDTKTLIEASKNLTQKLKKLSKEVFTNKIDLKSAEESVRSKIGSGAVIESMRHHGKGIYSGTFSGTLNPALQDRYGQPKRDISTIIHILNDLLCATTPSSATLASKESKHSCTKISTEEPGKCLSCSEATSGQCSHDRSCGCLTPSTDICKKCDTAKAMAIENSITKCKLDQLRLVMQQKKQRREARKLKTQPYVTTPPKTIPSDQNQLKEEIETLA